MFLHVVLFTMLPQMWKVQLSSMNVSLQKVQLWLESFNWLVHQQQCGFHPEVADLGDLDETWRHTKKLHLPSLSCHLIYSEILGLFCSADLTKMIQAHHAGHIPSQNTWPLVNQRTSLCSRRSLCSADISSSSALKRRCCRLELSQTKLTSLVTVSIPSCISPLSLVHNASLWMMQWNVSSAGLSLESLPRPLRCPTIDGDPSVTTDTILPQSKPFFLKNCVNLLKTISPVVHPGRGSKQSSPSRNVFPSKNLTSTASCSISVWSQDKSMTSDMASAFFKSVSRQKKTLLILPLF